MLSRNELKYYSALLQKKYRKSEGKFIAEGAKIINEALNSGYNAEIILAANEFYENNEPFFSDSRIKDVRLEILKTNEFRKISDTKSPQGVAAVFGKKEIKSIGQVNDNLIAAFENISDPGNMGTIIRNCDWFGIKNILLSGDCAEVYNPKVLRASMGSVFHINIFAEENFIDSLMEFKNTGYVITAAHLEGENLYGFKKGNKTVIVFCNEANGPTPGLLKISDRKITIPPKGKAESLNVASASAVILSELTK